ncbi:MAG TPA: hypothetical protein VF452_04890, partial [Candidatus Binatia bacterium]
ETGERNFRQDYTRLHQPRVLRLFVVRAVLFFACILRHGVPPRAFQVSVDFLHDTVIEKFAVISGRRDAD